MGISTQVPRSGASRIGGPIKIAVALIVGWAIGSAWPAPERATSTAEVVELRGLLLKEIGAAEQRCSQRVEVMRAELVTEIDNSEQRDRDRFADVFCLATWPRGLAPSGHRYAADWAWLNCSGQR